MSDKKSRFERRLAVRRALRGQPQPEPTTETPLSEKERHVRGMTLDEVNDWLKRNNATGESKRNAERRKR